VVRENDMSSVEANAAGSSAHLDLIFNDCALKAMGSDTMPKLEAYMRMALRHSSNRRQPCACWAN